MQYSLLFQLTPAEYKRRENPVEYAAFYAAFMPYFQAVKDAGIFVTGAGLAEPETATTIRWTESGTEVQDGPFADTKEQLGGFFVIDVPDLDTAMEWASRYPAQPGGGCEIRPVLPPRN